MAKMGITDTAHNLGADHTVSRVAMLSDRFRVDRLPVAGPPTTGIEFGAGIKQRLSAAPATVNTWFKMIPVTPGKGWLGIFESRDAILKRGEFFLILVVSFFHDEQLTSRCWAQAGGGAA